MDGARPTTAKQSIDQLENLGGQRHHQEVYTYYRVIQDFQQHLNGFLGAIADFWWRALGSGGGIGLRRTIRQNFGNCHG